MDRRGKLLAGAVLVTITAVVTFFISFFIFYGWVDNGPGYSIKFDPGEVEIDNVKKFEKVKSLLESRFYKDVDPDILLEGAVAGMAFSLDDPYTVYFTKKHMQLFNEKSTGSYVGIGVIVTMDENGLLTIVEPFKDSPAEKAGMKKGDKIIEVDGKDVTGIKDDTIIISMIKGKENTDVKITVFRPSERAPLEFEITRKKIKIINILSEVLPGSIGYIKIRMFDEQSGRYFEEYLENLIEKGIRGLVIDVRDNPGGSYSQVVDIIDRLVPEGTIVYTEDREGRRQTEKSDPRQLEVPIALLVNGNSASASEILAGAIKDHGKGTVIGTKTFGKGLVQVVFNLEDGSGLKVTVARYFTPSGKCIHGLGIEPDIKVELDEKYHNMPVSQVPREEDAQLQKAVQIINKIG